MNQSSPVFDELLGLTIEVGQGRPSSSWTWVVSTTLPVPAMTDAGEAELGVLAGSGLSSCASAVRIWAGNQWG
jgi:hypothetical protein